MSAPVLNPESGSPTRATAVPARSTRKATAQQTGRIGITCSLLTTLIQAGDPPNEIANCGLNTPNDSIGLRQFPHSGSITAVWSAGGNWVQSAKMPPFAL